MQDRIDELYVILASGEDVRDLDHYNAIETEIMKLEYFLTYGELPGDFYA